METKDVIAFVEEKECGTFKVLIPRGAPSSQAYEFGYNFLQKIVEIINQQARQLEPKKAEEEAKEVKETKPEK